VIIVGRGVATRVSMSLSDYAGVEQTFSFPSTATLGARLIQDVEKGLEAGVCVAAVDPGGTADKVGVIVGMVIFGVHGDPVQGKSFNGARACHRIPRAWSC
jgi:C-terminal processing protease CtpA/Prc